MHFISGKSRLFTDPIQSIEALMLQQQMSLLINLALVFSFIAASQFLYSPYWANCRIQPHIRDTGAIPFEALQPQRLPLYSAISHSHSVINPRVPLVYEHLDYYYNSFIDAGGSGQVFLVEEANSNTGKVLKRYLKQNVANFERQNYVFKLLNKTVQWIKDCGKQSCQQNQTDYHTTVVFPHYQTLSLRSVQFEPDEARLIFYKTLRELDKAHSLGIIHKDIKLGNVLVHAVTEDFKFFKLELIDWNLAVIYHTGYENSKKAGTKCYYSPELLFQTGYLTPATDIWSLGVLVYKFVTDKEPFLENNCNEQNMKAILSLVGAQSLLEMAKKYGFWTSEHLSLLRKAETNPEQYPAFDFTDLGQTLNAQHITPDFIDVLKRMLVADPAKRATARELMSMPYFRPLRQLPPVGQVKKQQKQQRDKKKEQDAQQL